MTDLSARAQQVLKLLVDLYIQDGQPIASKALAQLPQLQCSSATVRNIMADLEHNGFIVSPHTSAGRVPTAQGYRFFVDSLLSFNPVQPELMRQLQQQVDLDQNLPQVTKTVSSLLSQMTEMASVVTLPKREQVTFRHIEFIALSACRILVVLVLNEGEVQNRIITTSKNFTNSELERAGNFLCQNYAGQSLTVVRERIISAMHHDKNCIDQRLNAVLEVADSTLESADNSFDYAFDGHANLLSLADNDIDELRRLFAALGQKRSVLALLDQCLKADGVKIYIGEESGFNLPSCSIVTSPYEIKGQAVGMIGVVGPSRMHYDQVISLVDMTSKIVTAALEISQASRI